MSRSSYRKWINKYTDTCNQLSRVQKDYDSMSELNSLLESAREDALDEVLEHIKEAINHYQIRQDREGRSYRGTIRGLIEASETVQMVKTRGR